MFKSLKEKLGKLKTKAGDELDEDSLEPAAETGTVSKTVSKKRPRKGKRAGKKGKAKKAKARSKKARAARKRAKKKAARMRAKKAQKSGRTKEVAGTGKKVGKEAPAGDGPKKVKKVSIKKRERESFADGVIGKKLKDDKIDDILGELEVILLESDVALPVVEAITDAVRKDLSGRRVKIGTDIGDVVEDSLKLALKKVLTSKKRINLDEYIKKHDKPVSLMFVGVNGTGKTTTIAKMAKRYKEKGMECVMAAADTFRAGAIEQIGIHAERLGIKLIKHQAKSDPAAVAFDAVEHARAKRRDLVLIDTAGRMQTDVNLMDEMKKIMRVADPDLVIFVGDSLAGNDAVEQARKFEEAVGIDGAILTKIDADAKGGAALSIAYAVGKPILFVGTGQEYEDLARFSNKWMVRRLFGG